MKNSKQVSVVIPAYNEAENVPALVDALAKLEQGYTGYDFEFVLVDDGSTDATADVFRRESVRLKNAKLESHYFNEGLTAALVTGVAASQFTHIFFLPADLQYAPDIIPGFVDKADEGYDVVTGKKVGTYEKRFVSGIYNWLSRLFFKVKVSDINSVKLFHRGIIENLTLHKDWHRFIVPLASLAGKRITEIPVELFPRRHGASKFSGKLRILIGAMDLVSVRVLWSFKQKPMLIFGMMASLSLFVGFVSGCYFTYSRLISPLPYEPSITFVALFLMVGVLLFMAGFLGEIIIEASGRDRR